MIILNVKGDERYGKRKQQKPDKAAGTAASAEKPEKRKQEKFQRKISNR